MNTFFDINTLPDSAFEDCLDLFDGFDVSSLLEEEVLAHSKEFNAEID